MPTRCASRARSLMSAWICASMPSMRSRMPPRSAAAGVAPATALPALPAAAAFPAVAALPATAAFPERALRLVSAIRFLILPASSAPALEFLHEADERQDPLARHRVVEAGAQAAQHPMPLEVVESGSSRLLDECRLELGRGQRERHVHPRPGIG